MKNRLIIGIETSCDDTSVCILLEDPAKLPKLLFMESYSSELILKNWGGIVPEIAARDHHEKIVPLIKLALSTASIKLKDIDAISITTSPGLLGPLLTGINAARTLSLLEEIPIYSANHLIAHLEAIHLTKKVTYPYLGLLISGGHSLFAVVKSPSDIEIIGSTTDDAAGEAFDKGGKLLGLGYPAGRIIDELSKDGNENKYEFPIGLEHSKDCNLSFSGIKTALRNFIEKNPESKVYQSQIQKDVCASYQKSIVDALLLKTTFALKQFPNLPLIIGGGVACNQKTRNEFFKKFKEVHFVNPKFCTDNAAMIANLCLLDFSNVINFPESLTIDAKSRYVNKKEFTK